MPAKFLDLDKVKKPLGSFTLNGTTYEVMPIKIRNVVNLTALEESLRAEDEDTSMQKQMETALELLGELIPECPREELEALDLDQFNALMEWVQGFGEDAVRKNFPKPAKQIRR